MSGYRTHPVQEVAGLDIAAGYEVLAQEMAAALARGESVVLEGFSSVPWEDVRAKLHPLLPEARWLETDGCVWPPERLTSLLAPTLTDDPVFGRLFRGELADLWDPAAVEKLRAEVRSGPAIVSGFGASLLAAGGYRVYLDVPREIGQRWAAEGLVTNLGAAQPEPFGATYKRLYFVDWPVLSRLKRAELPRLDRFVDLSDPCHPLSVPGPELRRALEIISRRPFRVKPWFAPGPWGGQWMREHFELPEAPNYAWSFELIAPENGVLLGDGVRVLEVPLDALLWQETDAVLGVRVAARYGSYFPLRFDYLDTMGGTNLSCQVHPRLDYMRDTFGEPFTQDETYYIVTAEAGARVFLGLRDGADVDAFRQAAEQARDRSIPFAIEPHVQEHESRPHDLFLIPSGTVHCSGAGNLVLEISATPYIYTFKIYDYLRADLRGNLRPIHLEHAFANLEETRRGQWVQDQLLARPVGVRGGEGWAEYRLGESDLLSFAVHRLEFEGEMADETAGRFLLLNLVDGERCWIEGEGWESVDLRFAETVVMPAAAGRFRIRNAGSVTCKVVKAFVKV